MADSVGPDINIGGPALGVIWTLTSIAIIVVIARCWAQYKVTHQLGLSDALIIISVCTISSFASLISVQYHYGWGRHYAYLTHHQQIEAIRYNWIGQPFGVMGSTLGRLSFIILMLQLFGTSTWGRRGLLFLFWAQVIPNSVVVITFYIQCPRVDALWDFSIQVKCWPADLQSYIGYGHTAWNGTTDLLLTCLPATMLWKLQMNLRLKLGLCFLLGLSFFAFIAVIMKIIKLKALSETEDYTFNTVSLFTWVVVEGTLVAIAASVPLLRPLIKKFRTDATTRDTHELNKYGFRTNSNSQHHNRYGNPNSIASNRAFSKLGSSVTVQDINQGDTGSEEGILPIQIPDPVTDAGAGGNGAGVRRMGTGIMKETSFSVRVRSLEEGMGGAGAVRWGR